MSTIVVKNVSQFQRTFAETTAHRLTDPGTCARVTSHDGGPSSTGSYCSVKLTSGGLVVMTERIE
jgi:hypothetical protein